MQVIKHNYDCLVMYLLNTYANKDVLLELALGCTKLFTYFC